MPRIPDNCAAIVLAAGKGTRMHSAKPKVMQEILGEPMLSHVLRALEGFSSVWIVAGHGMPELLAAFPENNFVEQARQLGTGHALACALANPQIAAYDSLLIVNGDAPLVTAAELEAFVGQCSGADLAFAVIMPQDCAQYGRVIRREGKPVAIVEARDYDQRRHGDFAGEVNAGIYFIRAETAKMLLPAVNNDNKSGEYYLTDLVALAVGRSLDVRAVFCGKDENLLGVNTPRELSNAEEILRGRIVDKLFEKGALAHAPQLVRCGAAAQIAPGAEITGPCEIYGATVIGSGARIHSHCVIRDSVIAEGAEIRSFSHLQGARVGPNALVGPYARLRPGATLEENAHVGNFVELKKAVLGVGAKANHLTYLGDAEIGAGANIGAGTITCNYDGKNKFNTVIGKKAFIGSNTALVAPVRVGANALVGAGSVITHDVPDEEMGIARARQKNLRRKPK